MKIELHRIENVKRTKSGRVTMVTLRLFIGSDRETLWNVRTLLTQDASNPKLAKKASDQWQSVIMHLAPHRLAMIGNVCAWATKCVKPCLNTAGRGRFSKTQLSRIARTVLFFLDRATFRQMLTYELERFAHKTHESGNKSAARLNGTSDLRFYRFFPEMFAPEFPIDVYYDYAKDPQRAAHAAELNRDGLRYHVTFSHDGENWEACETALQNGSNVAIVFRDKATVERVIQTGFRGFPVHNGDTTDQRFLDPSPSICALWAKGNAKHDDSGFVVDVA